MRSQDSPVQIEIKRIDCEGDVVTILALARQTSGTLTAYHELEKKKQHEKPWTKKNGLGTIAKIRILARIIEKESLTLGK